MSILGTVRDLDRLRQITQVLIRHGFGHLVAKMGLPTGKKAPPATDPATEGEPAASGESATKAKLPPNVGERLRLVLQDLGTTFVKLGQIVSTRPDVIPEDICVELKKLQDDVKAFPTAEAREVVERELGASVDTLFANFAEAPLACASVAQVYTAELDVDGEARKVVVKVQRPGIEATIERDLNLLHVLARLLERTIPESRIYSPTGLVDEFEIAIKAELDFTIEAQNAQRFAENFEGETIIRFPIAYKQASSRRVLTLEFFDGLKIDDAVSAGANGPWIAENAVRLLLKMVFEDGFFHADPHPGNILILPKPPANADGAAGHYEPEQPLVIGLLDLGLVGRLSPELRDKTTDLLLAAARNDPDALADALIAIGKPRKRVDREAFRAYTRRVSEAHLGKPLKEIEAAAIFRDLIAGAMKFEIEIPSELTMLFRAIMTIEGVGKEIDPELDVLAVAKPYLAKMLLQRYHPTRVARELWRDVGRLSNVARELPAQLTHIIEDLQRGDLRIQTVDRQRARATERLGRRLRSTLLCVGAAGSGIALLVAGRHPSLATGLLIGAAVWLVGHLMADWRHQQKDSE